MLKQGTLTEGGRISTIALNSSDQLLLIMKIYFFLFHKTAYLNEEVNRTKPSPSVSLPWPH